MSDNVANMSFTDLVAKLNEIEKRDTAERRKNHKIQVEAAKVKKSKVVKVLENQTNNDYQRRGIITKGAIVETEDGKCRILSRPGQSGTASGILIK